MTNPFASLSPIISLGLDIGSDSVKFVKIKRKGKSYELLSYGLVPISSLRNSPPEEQSRAVSDVLRGLLKNETGSVNIYTAVNQVSPFSTAGVTIKTLSLPSMSKAELEKAIVWAAKKNIPQPLEECSYDYLVAGEVKEKQAVKKDIILVAASKNLINDRILLYDKSGLEVSGITVTPFALWNLNKSTNIDLSSGLLVDIGAKFTTIAIFQNNILTLSREILTAGDSITESIIPVSLTSYEEAERLKKEADLKPDGQRSAIAEEIASSMDRLISEIHRSFSFHQKKYPESPIRKVYLTGGTACLKGLPAIMREELDIEVEVVNPFENIRMSLSPPEKAKLDQLAPVFSLATGLALGGGEGINLMPPELRRDTSISRLTRVFAVAAALLALILFLVYMRVDNEVQKSRRLLAGYEERLQNEMKTATPASNSISGDGQECRAMAQVIRQLTEGREKINPSFLKELTNISPNSVTLESLSVEYPEEPKDKVKPEEQKVSADQARQASQNKDAPDKKGANQPLFHVKGIVGKDETPEVTLAKFMLDLDSSAFLKNPRILSEQNTNRLGQDVLEFDLACDLK